MSDKQLSGRLATRLTKSVRHSRVQKAVDVVQVFVLLLLTEHFADVARVAVMAILTYRCVYLVDYC